VTSQTIYGPKNPNKIPYVSPANRNNSNLSFVAGKMTKSKNMLSKCSISRKYVELNETRVGKAKIQTQTNQNLSYSRGGSFDNRNKTADSNPQKNSHPHNHISSTRAKVGVKENIVIEDNYGDRSRAPLKMIENHLNLSGIQEANKSQGEYKKNNTIKKIKMNRSNERLGHGSLRSIYKIDQNQHATGKRLLKGA